MPMNIEKLEPDIKLLLSSLGKEALMLVEVPAWAEFSNRPAGGKLLMPALEYMYIRSHLSTAMKQAVWPL